MMAAGTLGCVQPASAADSATNAARTEIEEVLEHAYRACSAGHLDECLELYAPTPDVQYIAGDKAYIGIDRIKALFRDTFGVQPNGDKGKLSFEMASFRQLGPDHAAVTGAYRYRRPDGAGPELSGLSSLIFEHEGGKWRVILDHVS